MLVSIIIPTYNNAEYIREAITSVLNQTHKPVEIIVVDDGSTDETRKILEQFETVKYVYQRHSGLAAALNTGVKHSRARFYSALGADDKLHPTYITRCLTEIVQEPRIGFVWTATQTFGDSTQLRTPRVFHHRYSILMGAGGQLGAALTSKETFEDVDGYDPAMIGMEDWDFAIRAVKKGWRTKAVMEPLHYYRIHPRQSVAQERDNQFYKKLQAKHPVMKLYVPAARMFDLAILLFKNPKVAGQRLFQKIRK